MTMFKTTRPHMQNLVSEASPHYEDLASPIVREAVARAERTANLSTFQAEKNLGLDPEIQAKYKIEIIFEKGRTSRGPNMHSVVCWQNGKRLHGGGDETMFWCMNVDDPTQGCGNPIPSDGSERGMVYCTHCKKAVNSDKLTFLKYGESTTTNLAGYLTRLFRILESSADIYLKYHKDDVHYIAMLRSRGPEVAAKLKGMHIYPLKNILKDTASGADLSKRIFTFLTS